MRRKRNVDDIVNYATAYGAEIQNSKTSGTKLTGLCPFHEDKNSSFTADLTTGQWYCFSEGIGGNYINFYAKLHNVDESKAFELIMREHGQWEDAPEQPKPQKKPAKRLKELTLEQYADAKHLPVAWLETECRLETREDRYQGVKYLFTPYIDEDGKTVRFSRKRYGDKEFRWNRRKDDSQHVSFYGEWKLPQVRNAGYVVLCEGESDSQSLWYMGISALGIPGASMYRAEQSEILNGLKVYIHKEADGGGETFFRKVTDGLRLSDFQGDVFCFSCPKADGFKDPSDILVAKGREDGKAAILKMLKSATPVNLAAREEIPIVVKGQPIGLRQPHGWTFGADGVFRLDKDGNQLLVCKTLILLTHRVRNIETGLEKLEVSFRLVRGRRSEWVTRVYPRDTLLTSRGIISLTNEGCMVSSENAKSVVKFLTALEETNDDILDTVESTSYLGWQPDGRFIPGLENGLLLDAAVPSNILTAISQPSGTLEQWIESMQPYRNIDAFRFILAASFAAPLLRILNVRVFIVYNWGNSGGGKTAALKAALSVWGNPEAMMITFNSTKVGIERATKLYNDLPCGIDERQATNESQVGLEQLVYSIASGTEKARGDKQLELRETRNWRNIVLATGEEPMIANSTQMGAVARMVEVCGTPIPNADAAYQMHSIATESYGHAGREYIRWVSKLDTAWLRSVHKELTNRVLKMKDDSSVLPQSKNVAAVMLADALSDWFLFRYHHGADCGAEKVVSDDTFSASVERAATMAQNILGVQSIGTSVNLGEKAVQVIVDWIFTNPGNFEANSSHAYQTQYGWVDKAHAYIFNKPFSDMLLGEKMNSMQVLRYLAENKYIETTMDNGRLRYAVKATTTIMGKRPWVIKFDILKAMSDGYADTTKTEAKCGVQVSFAGIPKSGPMKVGAYDEPDDELPF